MTTRHEAAVKAWDHYWGDRYGDEAMDEMGEEVAVALESADAHDAAHGVHRVAIDEATVERVVDALVMTRMGDYNINMPDFRQAAREVLAAAVGGGGE